MSYLPLSDDYYERLGVNRDATPTEINRAYKKFCFKYHPDRNPDDPLACNSLRLVEIRVHCTDGMYMDFEITPFMAAFAISPSVSEFRVVLYYSHLLQHHCAFDMVIQAFPNLQLFSVKIVGDDEKQLQETLALLFHDEVFRRFAVQGKVLRSSFISCVNLDFLTRISMFMSSAEVGIVESDSALSQLSRSEWLFVYLRNLQHQPSVSIRNLEISFRNSWTDEEAVAGIVANAEDIQRLFNRSPLTCLKIAVGRTEIFEFYSEMTLTGSIVKLPIPLRPPDPIREQERGE